MWPRYFESGADANIFATNIFRRKTQILHFHWRPTHSSAERGRIALRELQDYDGDDNGDYDDDDDDDDDGDDDDDEMIYI